MTKHRVLLWVVTFTIVAGLALPALGAPKKTAPVVGQKAGNISALLPVTKIVRGAGKAATATEAKKGDEVIWNDLVRTEKGGRARITLADQSLISVGSQAELRIVKHDSRSQQTALQLTYGRVRAEVSHITRDGGRFELRTPTAVAGVIGTDFGVTSGISESTFICLSGAVSVASADAGVPGSTQCEPGQVVSVLAGRAPTKRPATQQEIQQLIQDTEPALVSAMSPGSALAGSTLDATVSGTNLSGVNAASVSGSGVAVALRPGVTATSVSLSISVAADAQPGPRTITLGRSKGDPSATVFTVLAPPRAGAAADPAALKQTYSDLMESERQSALASLNAISIGLQQSLDSARRQIESANQTLTSPVDTAAALRQLQSHYDGIVAASTQAGATVNEAAHHALNEFNTRFDAAWTDLQARAPGAPDDAFRGRVSTGFNEVNAVLLAAFAGAQNGLSNQALQVNGSINEVSQTWMTQITQAAAAQQVPPSPRSNVQERAVEQGAGTSFDANNSVGSGGATITSYRWDLCDASYRPANVGVAIAANAPGCNPLPGYSRTTPDFNVATCNLAPNDYTARLTVTDSNGKSAALDVRLRVMAPAYDSPRTRLENLAAAYSGLQSEQFLAFFDQQQFRGLSALQENIRNTFAKLSGMRINLRVSQDSVDCDVATLRADWDQFYTFRQAPSQEFHQTEQLTMTMGRTVGRGWFITALTGDNGTVQGAPPGPVVTDTALPDLQVLSVAPLSSTQTSTGTAALQAISIPVPSGSVRFAALVVNVGNADLTRAARIEFRLTDAAGTVLTSYMGDIPVPLPANGGRVEMIGALTVPNLPPGTAAKVMVVANPNNEIPERAWDNLNTSSQDLVVGGVNLQLFNLAFSGRTPPFLSGQTGTVVFEVKNTGDSTSSPVSYSCSLNQSSGSSATLGSGTLPALAPGATSSQVHVNFVTPRNMAGTDDTITCQAARDSLELSSQLADNSARLSAAVNLNVDLQFASAPQPPAVEVMGVTGDGAIAVRNAGPDDAPAGWTVDISFAPSGTTASSIPVGSAAGPALAAGASTTVNVPVHLPVIGTPPADVSGAIAAELNANRAIAETDLSNNHFSTSMRLVDFQLTVSPPLGGAGVVGRTFSFTPTLQIAPSPWPLSSPQYSYLGLAAGLTFGGPLNQTIQGTPTAGGVSTVTMQGSVNGIMHAATPQLSFSIFPELTVASATLPATLRQSLDTANPLVQDLSVAVDGGIPPITVAVALPNGVFFQGSAARSASVVLQPGGDGVAHFSIWADVTSALGSVNLNITLSDNGSGQTPGNTVNFLRPISIAGAPGPDYVPTGIRLNGRSPVTGNNALQIGESPYFVDVDVANQGDQGPGTSDQLPVTVGCSGPPGSNCGTSNPVNIIPPQPGQTVTVRINLDPATQQPNPGSYSFFADLGTALFEVNHANNTLTGTLEVMDFAVVADAPHFTTQNIPIGGTATIPFKITETGPVAKAISLSANAGTAAAVTVPPSALPTDSPSATVTVPTSTPPGPGTVDVKGNNFGVSHGFGQPVQYYDVSLQPLNLFLNDASHPLELIRGGASFTLQLKLAGAFSTADGFSDLNFTTATGYTINVSGGVGMRTNDIANITVAAQSTVASTVVPISLHASIPATNPAQNVTYTLWVRPVGLPDLQVVSVEPAVARDFTLNPLMAGEPIDLKVTITNGGAGPSAGNNTIHLFLNNMPMGQGVAPALDPGATTAPIVVHCAAPDSPFTSSAAAIQATISPDALGDANPSNNFAYLSPVTVVDWTVIVNGPGAADGASALTMVNGAGGQAEVRLALSQFPTASLATPISLVAGLMRNAAAGTGNVGFNGMSFSAPSFNTPSDFVTVTINPTTGSPADGVYYAQVIGEMRDGARVTARRQATIHIKLGSGTAPFSVSLASSAGNIVPGTTAGASPMQINGVLPANLQLTASTGCTGGCSNPTVDLHFTPATTAGIDLAVTPPQLLSVPMGAAQPMTFTAVEQADGTITTGLSNIIVSATGHQPVAALRAGIAPPVDPVGSNNFTLSFRIGDIAISSAAGSCIAIPPGSPQSVPVQIDLLPTDGFNATVQGSWEAVGGGSATGLLTNPPSIASSCTGGAACTYPSMVFNINNVSTAPDGLQTFVLALVIQGASGTATKYFPLDFDLSTSQRFCPTAVGGFTRATSRATRTGFGSVIRGVWKKSAVIGKAGVSSARPAAGTSDRLPDLRLNAGDVSYTPSMPRAGDRVEVRFRVTNAGDADALQVPIALQVDGAVVAVDKFDVAAGKTTLGGLEWVANQNFARSPRMARMATMERRRAYEYDPPDELIAGRIALDASVVIDPGHVTRQKSTVAKSAKLSQFGAGSLSVAAASTPGSAMQPGQRLLLELTDGACVGFRFASGAASACGSTDLEITVDDLAAGRYSLSATSGVADLGMAATPNPVTSAQFLPKSALVSGHSYAVQLSAGKVGVFTVQAIRSPQQLQAKTRKVFRKGARVMRKMGDDSGPVETGDVANSSGRTESRVYFDVTYTTP